MGVLVTTNDGRSFRVAVSHGDFLDREFMARVESEVASHAAPMASQAAPSMGGAGTELKALLRKYLGISASPGCQCLGRAAAMDARGCEWCSDNSAQIISWLKEEHARQKIMLPFSELAAHQLLRMAIRNARKKGTCR